MCGISAVVALESFDPSRLEGQAYRDQLESTLDKSLDAIKHRGPDDRGCWISPDNRVALGHVRLSINDLSAAGHQPLRYESGGIYAVVNGELYGYEELRAELEEDYEFTSGCDSELVIPLYLKYGTHFLSKLRGEFSIVLYDSKSQVLVAARDRYGVKPLFWTIYDDRLLLASEAKAFLALGWRARWDVRSIIEDGWLHDERTLFKGVHKLRPGHYLTCSSYGYTQTRQYWDVEYPDKHQPDTRTEEEMVLGLRERLKDAIRLRMQASDVPVGIYLSGGIDSAVVAGMAAELHKELNRGLTNGHRRRKPVCFGIGFQGGTEFDETDIARRMADSAGLEFRTRRTTERSLADNFAAAVWHSEHPNPDLNFVGKYMLSSLPRENGFKVVLSGEGSDEHFGGYTQLHADFLREPDYSREGVDEAEGDVKSKSGGGKGAGGGGGNGDGNGGGNGGVVIVDEARRRKLTRDMEERVTPGYKGGDPALARGAPPTARRMLNGTAIASCLWAVTMARFAEWTRCYGANLGPWATRANNPDARVLGLINDRWHPLHTAQYVWIKSILPNLILTCMGDRMEMAHSIEGRPPFLDHQLTAYCNALPPSVKVRMDADGKLVEKWILREAARPYITDELYRRRKHPFSAPIAYPPGGPVHQLLTRLLTPANVDRVGFLDPAAIDAMLRAVFGPDSCDDGGKGLDGPRQDPAAMRFLLVAAQWVVLAEQFDIPRAEPPYTAGANAASAAADSKAVATAAAASSQGWGAWAQGLYQSVSSRWLA